MRRRSFFAVLVLAAAVSLASSSCLSPTLPLPPPEQPTTITAGATPGTWEVFGNCNPGALVTVFNEKAGHGVVVEDRTLSGVYHVTIEATECDLAWVKEELGNDETTRTSFVLAARKSGDPTDNPACH